MSAIQNLREQLGPHLCDPDHLKRPEGIPSGLEVLDRFLLSGGFPKGALSLCTGELGLGSTSLWVHAASVTTRNQRWAAWINREAEIFPLCLHQRQLDLSRLLVIERPETEKRLAWLLQELMASQLFDLVGCDLGTRQLSPSQLRKLQIQARSFQTALIFFAEEERASNLSMFEFVLRFQKRQLVVERALHRPTPSFLARSISYASFTSSPAAGFAQRLSAEPGKEQLSSADASGATRHDAGSLPERAESTDGETSVLPERPG